MVAIPTLTSLLPRAARSQDPSPPVRYVQWITNHGQYPSNFFPAENDTGMLTDVGSGVRAVPLSAYSGSLSAVLGSAFDPFRGKMNVIRGLDVITSAGLHNSSAPTCASANQGNGDNPCDGQHECFDFKHSADGVMEDFAGLYTQPVRARALRLTPGLASSTKWGSFCWRNGEKLFSHDTIEGAVSEVFGDAPPATTSGPSPADQRRVALTDAVLDDYRAVTTNPAVSSVDRHRLQDYMDLLAQMRQASDVAAPETCEAPALRGGTNADVLHQNATDLATAALACGATCIVAYHCFHVSSSEMMTSTHHEWSHNGSVALHGGMQAYRYRQLARLISNLDSLMDEDGNTVLDNSIVYGANELFGWGGHRLDNMPIVTAGGAGGRLRTGQYIDFGKRPINNMLVTLFHAMGLEPADYERNGQAGFGDYRGNNASQFGPYIDTDAARRAPLPYLTLA